VPDDDDKKRAPEQEGVRIIGAEEAAEALGRGDVAHRRGEGEPRFGDRPEVPSVDGPRPTIRFPLAADDTPEPAGTPRPAPPPSVDLPHWTEPPTGEVPRIFAVEDLEGGDDSAWSSFTSGQPRWRGEGPDLDDDYDDFSRLADDETRIGAMASDDRPDPEDFFAFDDDPAVEDEEWVEGDPVAAGGGWVEDEGWEEPQTRSITSDPRRVAARRQASPYQRPGNAGRDVPVAVGVGVAFAVIALICFSVGPVATAGLVTVVLGIAAAELFNVLRQAGYQPATLLGLSAAVALPIAAYNKGESGIPLVLFLTVVFGLVWYFAGAGGADRPGIGLSSTLFGVAWIGLLGSFAALLVADPLTGSGLGEHGIGVLLVAVLGTVGYDVGAFVVGRNAGTRPLSAASPNKTIEGLLGGIAGAVILTVAAGSYIYPFSEEGFAAVLLLAVGIAVAAPLGDLCESLVKRDLDVKDMGTILPGHGGFVDRFDALLFVLPTVYYLSRVIFT
jgi:phosphatidate cytidylyltransferase